MKYTLNSQEYNDIFKGAQEKFDTEMLKREKTMSNMAKKLMIINYANEFINNKIEGLNLFNKDIKVIGLFDIISSCNSFFCLSKFIDLISADIKLSFSG